MLFFALAACGDNAGYDPCAVDVGESASLRRRIEDVPAPTGCVPGAIDAELSGRWHRWDGGETSIFEYSFPILQVSCAGGLTFPGSLDASLFTRASSDELSWSVETEDGVESVRACVTADGSLSARRVVCVGDSCETRPIGLTRFERLPGEGIADGLALLGENPGSQQRLTVNVRVRGGLAYVAQRGSLRIFDVSDPRAPRQVGVLPSSGDDRADYNDVKLVDAGARRFAILAGGQTPVVEVTDPAAPRLTGLIGEYSHSVFVDEQGGRQLLYLATYGQDVPVFDVTDPTAPLPLGRALGPVGMRVHDLFADDGMIYANGSEHGFVVLDARSSIGQATVLGSTDAKFSHASWVGVLGGRRVALHGDEGHGAHLRVLDVDPASPTFLADIGSWQTREEVSIHNLMLVGDTAYIAHYQDGVRVLDVSDPTAPRQIAYYNTWDVATGRTGPFSGAIGIDVDAATGLVYVADTERGLLVLSRP